MHLNISCKAAKAPRILCPLAPWREVLFALVILGAPTSFADEPPAEIIRYLRPDGKGHVHEATFVIWPEKTGCTMLLADKDSPRPLIIWPEKTEWTIQSVTERGDSKVTVWTRYGEQDRLLSAAANLTRKDEKTTVAVKVKDSKAKVRDQEFDVPPGTIVTSAPDWSDIFLLCRKYDAKKAGKQTFPGLWIHPTQPAQLLKFTIERQGKDGIDHNGKRIELSRFRIQIRGSTPYQAWADEKGTLVKLVPGGIVREGFEESTMELGAKLKK